MQPRCAAFSVFGGGGGIGPAQTTCKSADGIEIAFQIGERVIPRRVVQTFFAGFASGAHCQDWRLNSLASVKAILAADLKQANVALARVQVPLHSPGHCATPPPPHPLPSFR